MLHLAEVEKPAPKDDEVLIKIHAASANSPDWRLLRANPFFIRLMAGGLLEPKKPILGAHVAGRVEGAGVNARQFRPQGEVFGCLSINGGSTFSGQEPSPHQVVPGAGFMLSEAGGLPCAPSPVPCSCPGQRPESPFLFRVQPGCNAINTL